MLRSKILSRQGIRPIRLIRGIKYSSKQYPPSAGFTLFSEDLETTIQQKIKTLPNSTKVFQNADGTSRNPSDEELKQVAELGILANVKRATLFDRWKLSTEQQQLLNENTYYVEDFVSNGRKILDKIPSEDPITGEIQWTIIREKQKEGWEGLMYYGYVPGLLIAMFFALFLDKEDINDWAMEELKLRAQERYNKDMDEIVSSTENLSAEDLKRRDALIVERIISGDYDRLAGLRKAGADMPTTLL